MERKYAIASEKRRGELSDIFFVLIWMDNMGAELAEFINCKIN
jgi:hypothetical protein